MVTACWENPDGEILCYLKPSRGFSFLHIMTTQDKYYKDPWVFFIVISIRVDSTPSMLCGAPYYLSCQMLRFRRSPCLFDPKLAGVGVGGELVVLGLVHQDL